MPYNPFDKPIGDKLSADDLQKLIGKVAEGYFVEYKSDFPANDKIGRSIASFANTYGGWYIVGVKTDNQHVANDICGFGLSNYPDAISKVRDIAKHSIDPVPVLYPQVVELDKDKAVLIVQVPGDQETPFISKDGRIYRRNHDSSDPVPEASRYTIDRLVDNGRDIAKQFGKFCSDKRTFSKAEEQLSWINIFLSPYPIGTIERLDVISSEGIEQLLKLSQTPHKIYLLNSVEFGTGNLPLNFGQPTFGSAILRQVESSKAAFNSLTIELFVNGRAKFFIPLRYLLIQKDGTEHIKSPRVRVALGELWEADRESSTSYLRFFDIGQLWMMVANLVGYYREWLGKGPGLTDMRVGISVENVWRSVAFCDMDSWGTHIQKFGLPIMNRDAVTIPEDIGRGWLVSLDEKEVALWVSICNAIGLTFGLPANLFSDFLVSLAEQRPQVSA